MCEQQRRTPTRAILSLLIVLALSGALQAQESPTEASLSVAEAADFVGEWVLSMESPQGSFDADFVIKEMDGQVVAELQMPRLGSRTITDMSQEGEGLALRFETAFGEQQFKMTMKMVREGSELRGTLGDESGLFLLDFKGLTKQNALALETSENRGQRRRSRRGSSSQTRLTLAEKEIRVRYDQPSTSVAAYGQVTDPTPGEVVPFIGSRPSKLWTAHDLRFGDAVIKAGNVAQSYPGVYSLWLKKGEDGWRLVFNQLPDVWGTQHESAADVAEVPLVTNTLTEEAATFTVELQEEDAASGVLRIAWGFYEWKAAFSVVQ